MRVTLPASLFASNPKRTLLMKAVRNGIYRLWFYRIITTITLV